MEIKRSGDGWRTDQAGWIRMGIVGDAFSRGYQHGYLCAKEIGEIIRSLQYLTYFNTGKGWGFFVEAAHDLWADKLPSELANEMKGISSGCMEHGVYVSWEDILAWNGYEELTDYWWPTSNGKLPKCAGHCSAFIAHRSATRDGKVVMAHNSFNNFDLGFFSNLLLTIEPAGDGNTMFMQSSPGWIDSFADFFVTSAGIMGTETTIGGFNQYDPTGVPEFVRVRLAMQYANALSDFVDTMLDHNNGGYANSWLLADADTDEIMRFELGLKYHNIEVNPASGYFIGFNAPIDPRIRNMECENTGFADIRRHQGARQVRLDQMCKEHHGMIDVHYAKQVLADHHDVYRMQKIGHQSVDNPSSRTICGHYERDPRDVMSQHDRPLPFQPRGAVDGKTMDSEMAKGLPCGLEAVDMDTGKPCWEPRMWARWGNSCGRPFNADDHIDRHPQWEYLRGYLKSHRGHEWIEVDSACPT